MAQYGAASPSPAAGQKQGQQQAQAGAQHKRVYQACIPCRRRKVRCDLGSVDNPNDPPCVRCRRESKECYFSATRRKRKTDDADGSDVDEYIVRNGRKRVYTNEDTPPAQIERRRQYSDVPLTPGGSQGRSQPLRRPDGSTTGTAESVILDRTEADLAPDADGDEQMENPDAQTVMRRGVYGPHDALDLLYKAATDTARFVHPASLSSKRATANRNSDMTTQVKREDSRVTGAGVTPNQPRIEEPVDRTRPRRNTVPGHSEQPVDPDLDKQDLTAQPGYAEAVKAWMRFRFVRAGWFTPHEAIEYID